MIISGTEISSKMKTELKASVEAMRLKYGRVPHLTVVLVGDDPASVSYVGGKARTSAEIGIRNTTLHLPEDTSEEALLSEISRLASDDGVDGILVQLPLPPHMNEDRVIDAIPVQKDVDGFHPLNVAALWLRRKCVYPCTPKGVMRMLDEAGVQIEGKRAVVIGRSNIVGLPMTKMLMDRNATVSVAHRRTADLKALTLEADIVVSAAGSPALVKADMIKEGAVLIDVGFNRDPQSGKLCGDIDFEGCVNKASYITRVPGGVGQMTLVCLMENTLECFLAKMEKNI